MLEIKLDLLLALCRKWLQILVLLLPHSTVSSWISQLTLYSQVLYLQKWGTNVSEDDRRFCLKSFFKNYF